MTRNPGKLIPDDFRATPSLDAVPAVAVVSELDERNLDAIGVLVTSDGDLPGGIGLDREALAFAGFEAKPGTTHRAAERGAARSSSSSVRGRRRSSAPTASATRRRRSRAPPRASAASGCA